MRSILLMVLLPLSRDFRLSTRKTCVYLQKNGGMVTYSLTCK
ncbi:hypothetical protein YPPY07_2011 [Yersinia pestis PY-07]|nr:hypothetical protein YPPY03_2159 [Yersinia pestis PY-03]EIR18519.1 hypothetical protein YPPY07_2011 [Yersinia pestis PY-07]EIR34899.1 hypothetical protein YPPY12_2266 [Yersinia pestis PY-12]EIT59398.1 hypothetical protein YPPY103_2232 [Yersinia pestis PY-103]